MPIFNLSQLHCSRITDPETGCSTCNGQNDPGYQACRQSFFLKQQNALLKNIQATTPTSINQTAVTDASTTQEIVGLKSSMQQLQMEYQQLENRVHREQPLLEQSLIIGALALAVLALAFLHVKKKHGRTSLRHTAVPPSLPRRRFHLVRHPYI